jgi:predicted transcriptional regulator
MGFLFNTFLTNEYISNYNNPQAIKYVKTMAEDLKTVFIRIIRRNNWMQAKTKKKALEKLHTFKYYKKDNDIKNIILNRDDIIMEFINILFDYYNEKKEYPKQIKMEIEDNNDDDDYKTLFNLFDFTNNEDDYINNDDLKIAIKLAKIPFELKKCKMLLKTKGAVDGRNKASRGLKGLKLVSDDS